MFRSCATIAIAWAAWLPAAAADDGAAQFLGIDRDLSGFIDRAETDQYRARLFGILDLDRDGAITAEEWIEATKARSAVNPERTPETPAGMKEADTDRDGRVTLEEMQAAGRARFARMDRDQDGRLSPAEYHRNGL